ncbi:M14 family metallopeptidase [Halalkalibacillus halophilus]|uniref:M14 family metallopeptidase n=1 Tax=Halalkalibacillus halophilus TaxID=392827 RepID=UPI000425E8CA|nr:M14 family metallopeptidase [Halalkalibacillus halophilus]
MELNVRAGESFWYYSNLFGIPLPLIIDSNPNYSYNTLQIGAPINIPGYEIQKHLINSGDSFFSISNQYQINMDVLMRMNPEINPNNLPIGQTLNIPQFLISPVVQVNTPYTSQNLQADLNKLIQLYPFIKRNIIGQSVMGKELTELRIGTGDRVVHMNGSFHANEWITSPILMQTINEYLIALTSNGDIRGLSMFPFYNTTTLSIVPMVNPDGVDLVINGLPEEEPFRSDALSINNNSYDFSGWKANIRGVDLNNQYPALWEEEAAIKPKEPAPRNFPGYAPLTEPESIAIAELTSQNNFNMALAYHTQGKVIFWGFQGLEPPESEIIVNEFARVSGYQPIQYVPSYAGYKDWFIQDFRRPGFTVELGRGVNPLPLSQFDEIYQENLGIFLASLYM